jgi:putative tryptophan/tyrosine transport system substrate-binding protein
MKRREFITLVSGAAATCSLVANAQQPLKPIIGFLSSASPVGWDSYLAAFRDGLRRQGFYEGSNVTIEYRWAEGKFDRLPSLAAELANLRVTAMVASGGVAPAVAASKSSSTIPIVFTGVPDPVERGLIASLNRPGSNMTGVSIETTELLPKRFELLSALIPRADVFGLFSNSNSPSHLDEVKVLTPAVSARGKSLVSVKAGSENDFESAFDILVEKECGALVMSVDSFFNIRRDALIALAARNRIPTIYGWPEFARAGGMASYGPDLAEQYRLSGIYVGRILKGERPQDLPVMQPTKFNFLLNLTTMKALNIEAPANVLALADEVIE